MNEDELLAALNSGLESAGGEPAAPSEETTDETADETNAEGAGDGAADGEETAGDGGDGADGDGAGDESAAGEDADGEGKEGGEGEGDGRERDPATGKFLPKKKDGEAPKEGDGAAPGADGKQPPKGKDPVNDPIPAGLKKETHERMQSLITTAKTLTAERDQFRGQYEEVMGYIAETQCTPVQYAQALDYLKAVNSGDPAQIQKCVDFMQQELAALSKILGKPVAGVDLLKDHADLQQKVADGQLSRQDAEELAAARNNQAMRTDHARYTQEQNQASQRAQQERQNGMAALNTLEGKLKAQDSQYMAKRAGILTALRTPDPKTGKSPIESTPPSQWTALFLEHYALAKAPAARTPTITGAPKGKVPTNQPLRARNPAGAATAAPKSLLDAVSMGIDQAGR